MLIITSDRLKLIFLCGLEPYQVDQIRLSVLSARNCEHGALRILSRELTIGVGFVRDKVVLGLRWNELMLLMYIMIKTATDNTTKHNAVLVGDIIVGLTCALEMRIKSKS